MEADFFCLVRSNHFQSIDRRSSSTNTLDFDWDFPAVSGLSSIERNRFRRSNILITASSAGMNDHGLSQLTRAMTPKTWKRHWKSVEWSLMNTAFSLLVRNRTMSRECIHRWMSKSLVKRLRMRPKIIHQMHRDRARCVNELTSGINVEERYRTTDQSSEPFWKARNWNHRDRFPSDDLLVMETRGLHWDRAVFPRQHVRRLRDDHNHRNH